MACSLEWRFQHLMYLTQGQSSLVLRDGHHFWKEGRKERNSFVFLLFVQYLPMLLHNYTFLNVFWEENYKHSFSGSDPIPSPISHFSNFFTHIWTSWHTGPACYSRSIVLAHTLGPESQMPSLLIYLANPSSSINKGPWKFFWPTYTWFGSSRTSCASLFIFLHLLPRSRIFEVSCVCVCACVHACT